MPLETIIGLEIHVQLKTKSKMFCSCPNIFGDIEPNSAICPICMGYPGTLPVPNKKAIAWTQRIGAALNCELTKHSKFDRKSYFYPDLPKGYQISQFDQPFCGKGSIPITIDGKTNVIGITRVHLEEDAAKNIHPKGADYTLVDYNRAGTPLAEIVTEPDIRSPEQAKAFLQELRRIMRVIEVSDADMEKGQLRCDANISLWEGVRNPNDKVPDTLSLNPKTEIKNLNSFRNVERALKFEITRQTKEFKKGKISRQETTRGFNADTGATTQQRSKEGAADYRYFPEPDIPPFKFSNQELKTITAQLPELPYAKKERLMKQYELIEQSAQIFTDNQPLGGFFENTVSELEQLDNEQIDIDPKDIRPLVKLASNIILRNVREIKEELKITEANFAELIVLIHQGKISKNNATEVLAEMQKTGGDPDHIIQNLGLKQESDTGNLEKIIKEVISENKDVVAKVKDGKTSALQFLMGQVMKKTQGRAEPNKVTELLQKSIGK